MKRIYILVSTILLSLGAFAQAPQKMSYQAVIRDFNQAIVVNDPVAMTISVLQGSANGTEVYAESHNTTTNSNGLTSLEIGMGNVISGDFSTIDWANGPYFIKTETTLKGSPNYTITGTSQMLSVPFALYAANSGSSTPGPQGPQGPIGFTGLTGATGAEGISAYEVWLNAGNTGAETDFLASLQGATGPQGPIGFTGLTGPAGADGEDGKSAYYFWLEAGNTGTEAEFLASLQGPAGNAGPTGPQGPIGFTGLTGPAGTDGEDGKSAYYLWLEAGNTGTEAAFLASLQGPAGNDGATGPQGPAGTYTAGNGIDISGGVISTTAPSSPEFIFLQPDDLGSGYIGFGVASVVNGMSYSAATDEITLKAGKTYMLDGAVYLKDTETGGTYSFVFYDKTNDVAIGSESLQTSTDFAGIVINQPVMSGIITPATDIQVAVRDLSGLNGVINSSRGFFKITELK